MVMVSMEIETGLHDGVALLRELEQYGEYTVKGPAGIRVIRSRTAMVMESGLDRPGELLN